MRELCVGPDSRYGVGLIRDARRGLQPCLRLRFLITNLGDPSGHPIGDGAGRRSRFCRPIPLSASLE